MKRAAGWLLILSLACAAFAWWGMFTASGASHFDEMAGMIPFFAGVAAVVLLVAAALTRLLAGRRG